ncbi:uncharacterized protein LOC121774410 [Salvia splendens]|uniref:uncharacterized protein LOC121774410 n=1 Tax=Salvia splendens TaxID=180675 RepID=UPI001C2532D4|nr:uncharacterized protein LOC121774410 [Salvia splendens]
MNGVTDEQVRLRLFSFSLEDSAKDWLESLEPGSIRTWDAMVEKFLEKFYPPSEAIKRQHEIIAFQMTPAENIINAWERFKSLMKRCPNHGLTPTVQVITFFKGCVPEAQKELNLSSGGNFLKKGVNEVMEVIEELASNDEGWSNERSKLHRVASTTDRDPMSALSDKLDALTMKFDCMAMGQPSQEPQGNMEDVNYVNQGGNNRYYNNQRPNFQGGGYNQFGNKGHPNLSYGNPNNALQPPPGFTVTVGVVNDPKKMTTEDILKSFMLQSHKSMEQDNQRMEKVETEVQSMATHLKNIDTQISQISQTVSNITQSGKFPSNTIINPNDCKVVQLRSGKSYEGRAMTSEDRVMEKAPEEEELVEEVETETVQITSPPKENMVPTLPTPPAAHTPTDVRIPYPQRVQKKKKKTDAQFSRFLDIFRKVQINIPLVEALQQMLSYAKFLKDVVSNKRRWMEYETVNLTESCSAIIQKKLPAKLKDPGSSTISCIVGDCQEGRALCDPGASINLMPYSFFQKMKIGVLRPTTISLQMADRTVSYPKGIVEDILVKVGEFIFPADFVVLDMEEDRHVPLLLGRPFLATERALIDVHKGELTLRLNDESITFSIYDAMQKYDDENAWRFKQCNMIEVIDDCVREVAHAISYQDRLERCLSQSLLASDNLQVSEFTEELLHFVGALNSGGEIPRRNNKFLSLKDPADEEEKEEKKEELKSLPSHLKYKLLRVLRKHKGAIGWSVSDLKGISPTVCMHRILLDEGSKPKAQNQRRLNPIMQNVVKKEVLKWLKAGIIYAISDSDWVSPTQVVAKKGGMTVIQGGNDEMIATRLVTGWQVCIDYRILNAATRKDHFSLPVY